MAARRGGKRSRYWEAEPETKGDAGGGGGGVVAKQGARGRAPAQRRPSTQNPGGRGRGRGRGALSGKLDPFSRPTPLPQGLLQKYKRGRDVPASELEGRRVKSRLQQGAKLSKHAQRLAARSDLLLPEEAGFLEADEGEDTCTILQQDIASVVDITSSAKYFNLDLTQFGPYRINYTRNGRHLLLAGRRGHVAALDWHTKRLLCEMNVMERVNDIRWLHTETMFAVAQKKWLFIYDNQGIELHCLKTFNDVLRMEFLPYHFLLATCSAPGFLQYLDISVGKEVAAICTKAGRLDVMTHNPHNGIVHLGHLQGTVTLWSPNVKEPLVKMLCHKGGVRAVAVDKSGLYMATSGLDHKLNIFDVRTYKPLHSYLLPAGAAHLTFSQRRPAGGRPVQVYKDVRSATVRGPYLTHAVRQVVHGLQFCPYEDVLGVGSPGWASPSMLVPGAGEANFDGLECNPYRSKKQRQEWEVKALLEKLQPELISLEPERLGQVDPLSLEQRHRDRVQRLGYDPTDTDKFEPRQRMKGRSSSGNLERRKKLVASGNRRDRVRRSVEQKVKAQKQQKMAAPTPSLPPSALTRFHT
ncbi:WD repeat-containing protein 46-like [Rhinoraja longicauda]